MLFKFIRKILAIVHDCKSFDIFLTLLSNYKRMWVIIEMPSITHQTATVNIIWTKLIINTCYITEPLARRFDSKMSKHSCFSIISRHWYHRYLNSLSQKNGKLIKLQGNTMIAVDHILPISYSQYSGCWQHILHILHSQYLDCWQTILSRTPGCTRQTSGSEIDLSQPRHETAFWWRHNGPVTSQSTDLIKWPIYP